MLLQQLTGIPDNLWQWPALAALLLVIAWLLYQNKEAAKVNAEERREAAVERKENTAFIQKLVQDADHRQEVQLQRWQELTARNIEVQAQLVGTLESHDTATTSWMKDHEKLAGERHAEIVRRLSKDPFKMED